MSSDAPPLPGDLVPLAEEVVKRYLGKETSPMDNPDYLQENKEQKTRRLDRIKWINKTVILGKMKHVTAYLATSYFNSAVSCGQVPYASYDLLSVACLLVALKFEETNGFEADQFKEVKGAENFEVEDIFQAERQVLGKIRWSGKRVTPFDYISLFMKEFGTPTSHDQMMIFNTCSDIIIRTTEETLPLPFKPSVIAAAAVMVALQTKDGTAIPKSLEKEIDKGDLDKCCTVLRNMLQNKILEDESPLKKPRQG